MIVNALATIVSDDRLWAYQQPCLVRRTPAKRVAVPVEELLSPLDLLQMERGNALINTVVSYCRQELELQDFLVEEWRKAAEKKVFLTECQLMNRAIHYFKHVSPNRCL